MYFIHLSCFVHSLDSSACLCNNILPDMCNYILKPPKANDQNFINIKGFIYSGSFATGLTSQFYKALNQEENIALRKQFKSSNLRTFIQTLLVTNFPLKNGLDYKAKQKKRFYN